MSRKILWLTAILVLSIGVFSISVFAQEIQEYPFEIWPGTIDPPDGSVNIYVPEGQNIVIRTSFAACSRPLANNWTKFDRVTLSMNGNNMVSTAKESRSYWSSSSTIPNDGVPCVNGSDKLWVVDWAYDLGALPAGDYQVHFTEDIRGLFTDGADYDVPPDGIPDLFSWHINVDFNIIVAGPGSISGTVTEQDTTLVIEGLEVSACEFENDYPCWSAWTDEDGNYTISAVPAGIYRLATGWEEGWVVEAYNEQPTYFDGDPVILAGEDLTGYDFTLERGGSISGNVTEQDTGDPGNPIEDNIDVSACLEDDSFCGWTTVQADGTYEITALPAGFYRVHAYQYPEEGYWIDEIFEESQDWDVYTLVEVTAGEETSGINFTLEYGRAITGKVTANDGELIEENIDVSACFEDDSFCGWATVQEDGNYEIIGLRAGEYRVHAYQYPEEGYWIDEVYKDTQDWDAYTPVTVTAGEETTDINFTLELGGSISGVVTDESGAPIVDWVDACDESVSEEEWGSSPLCNGAETDENGFYTITGLRPGNYRVVVWGGEMYIHEYYEDTRSYYEATLVPVFAAVTTKEINFTLSTPEPVLSAWPSDDYAEGWGWDEGSLVTLTIDDPSNGPGIDYTDTQTVVLAEWNPEETYVSFNFQDVFDLQPGFSVMMTDITYTKQHTVTELTITVVDPDSDVASGTAAPGSHVLAWICGVGERVERHEIADSSGSWTADFSIPGDEPGEEKTFDIVPGVGVEVNQADEDGDATQIGWWIEEPYEPHPGFLVNLTSNEVHGWEWIAGSTVTITIDAPGVEWMQIYSDTTISEQNGPDPWETFTWFSFPAELGVGPGYRVTLTDDIITKEHIVAYLVVEEADADADTVSGMADPYAEVIVDSWLGANRRAVADGSGYWIVDFSVPGTEVWEQDVVDLHPGDGGGINQYDEDGDSTNINWWVLNPRLDAWPSEDYVDAWDWAVGRPLTITIHGPSVDYTDTQIPDYPDWDPNQTYAQFYFAGSFDLQPGDIITLENAIQSKVYTVTYLTVTGFDLDKDQVFGEATPESNVWVWVCDEFSCATRHEIAEQDGGWTADIGQPGDEPWEDMTWDLIPGSSGGAGEKEEDGDSTIVNWWVPE